MTSLRIENIHKAFTEKYVLSGISFDIDWGETVAVLGPSGCGKSTLLSVIAGLEEPDQGNIFWDQELITNIPAHKRDFGLMFQDFALFPHMDIFHNVAFGLQMAGAAETEIKDRVRQTLDLVGLPGFEKRDVNTLSGGESQRVALARSLAPQPKLLMLDEPLGSLDRNLRERLLLDLKNILSQSDQTALYVTHDQEEAYAIADRIVIMSDGKVEQFDAPQAIYRHPASMFVAQFLGLSNLLPGTIKQHMNNHIIETSIGNFPISGGYNGRVMMLIRPDSVSLDPGGLCSLTGFVSARSFRGSTCLTVINIDGHSLIFEFPSNRDIPNEGEKVDIYFNPEEAIQIIQES